MLLWILIILAFGAAGCFFVDAAKKEAWTARGLLLVALIIFIYLAHQAVAV